MHEFVSFNHHILDSQNIALHAASSAALYGKGVFTTIAIYDGTPFLWEKHWERLRENSKRLAVDISGFSEKHVKESLQSLVKNNRAKYARARLTFFDESFSDIWKVNDEAKTSLLITTAELRDNVKKLSLSVSPYPVNSRSPLVNTKSCNYLENIFALREAKQKGFDEAIRLNERNEIVSVCLANIFWVKDEDIFTPALETGALRGTTREFIMDNFDVFEVISAPSKINEADSVFITSSGIGIGEVKNIGGINYRSTKAFEKIQNLIDKFKLISQR